MGETIVSAAEAKRKFSRLLDGVRQGDSFIVTRHGKPIAKIEPVEVPSRQESAGRKALLDRLRHQRAMDVGSSTRQENYDE
jgi:prevent-host-death family protein